MVGNDMYPKKIKYIKTYISEPNDSILKNLKYSFLEGVSSTFSQDICLKNYRYNFSRPIVYMLYYKCVESCAVIVENEEDERILCTEIQESLNCIQIDRDNV